jgi:hypothetical protein
MSAESVLFVQVLFIRLILKAGKEEILWLEIHIEKGITLKSLKLVRILQIYIDVKSYELGMKMEISRAKS